MDAAKTVVRGEVGRRLQDQLLVDILNHAPDAIAIVEVVSGEKMIFLYVNEAFEALYLTTKEDAIFADVLNFMSERTLPRDVERTLALLAECKPFSSTRPYARSDGKTVWLETNFRPIVVENQPVRWISISRDITAKKLLNERAAQLSIAVEEGTDVVTIAAADEETGVWRFVYVNEAFTRTTGYLPEEIIGRTFMSIMPQGTSAERFREVRAKLFAGRSVREEVKFAHKNGTIGTFVINTKPIADEITGKYSSIVTIYRDVTEQRLHEAQLQYEAEHDPLTGLHNRRYFERMLGDSVAMQRPDTPQHALIFLDLDGFKEVNDRLGHEAGDEVLKAAASSFGRCVTGNDVLVRWGGDEFAALLFHCDIDSAERAASCMLSELHRAPEHRWVTASIGVAPVMPGERAADSIRRADRAAYAAKKAGGDRVVVLSV